MYTSNSINNLNCSVSVWAIPFNIPLPPMDEISKILTHKKKGSKCRQQNIPQKFVSFPLTPQKKQRDQRMPTGLGATSIHIPVATNNVETT